MKLLKILILLLCSAPALAQVQNPIPEYIFNNRLTVGKTGAGDTTAYLHIGPNGGAKKGIKLPMVTDTAQVLGLKKNGLTIFSVQLNQPVYWDSVIGRWKQMGGSLSHAPGTGDSLLFTAGNSLRLIASEFGVITTQYTNEVGFKVDTANIPTRYTIDSLGQIIVGNFPTAAIYEGLPGSPDSLTFWRNDSTLILRTPVPGDYLFSMAGTDTSWKWGVDTSQLFEDFREVSPNIYTGNDTLWSDRHVEINTRLLTIGTPFVQLYLQGQDYLTEPNAPQAILFAYYDTSHTQYTSLKGYNAPGFANVELTTSNESNNGEIDLNSSDVSTVYQLNISSASGGVININHTASVTDSKIESIFGINPSIYYLSNHSTASERPDSTAKIFPFRPSAQGDTVLAHDLITGQLYRTLASGTGGGGSPVNIYNTSDTLEGNRVMNLEDYYLRISDGKDSVNADIWIGGSSNIFSLTQRTQTTGYNGIYPAATWYNGIAASALSGDINKTIIYTGGGIVLQSGGSQNLGRDSLALPTISYSHKALVWDSTDGRIKQVVLPLAGASGDTANLIIQNVGSGQQTWYESGDSLFMKRLKNTYALNWTTDTDSSLLATIDTSTLLTAARTSLAANNGLTKTSNTIQLGGAFTKSNSHTMNLAYNYQMATTDFNQYSYFLPKWSNGGAANIQTYINYDTTYTATNQHTQTVNTTNSVQQMNAQFVNNGGGFSIQGTVDKSTMSLTLRRNPEFYIRRADISAVSAGYADSNQLILPIASNDTVLTYSSLTGRIGRTVLTGGGGGGLSASQVKDYVRNPAWKIENLMGSPVLFTSMAKDQSDVTQVVALTDARLHFVPVYITESSTITGVTFWQGTQGNYTADNENGISLYSYSGGTMTEVATTGDLPNIWKGAANSMQQAAFTSTYSASPGLYFVGFVYNYSAFATHPSIGFYPNMVASNITGANFTNSAKIVGYVTSGTLPSSQAQSGLTNYQVVPYMALY